MLFILINYLYTILFAAVFVLKGWLFVMIRVFIYIVMLMSFHANAINFSYDQFGHITDSTSLLDGNIHYFYDGLSNIYKTSNESSLAGEMIVNLDTKLEQNFSTLYLQWNTLNATEEVIFDLYLSTDLVPTLYKSGLNKDHILLDMSHESSPLYVMINARDPYGNTVSSSVKKIIPKDKDNDGVPDHIESLQCTDPNNADTDGDGLSDGLEMNSGFSDPCLTDSDHDGIDDEFEYQYGLDALNPNDTTQINDNELSNWQQYVHDNNIQAEQNDIPIIEEERIFNVTGKEALAYTGITPKGSQSMTLMYWVKFDHVNSQYMAHQLSGVDDGRHHAFYLGLRFDNYLFGGVGENIAFRNSNTVKGQWAHFALIYDHEINEMRLYLDGKLHRVEKNVSFEEKSLRSLTLGALNSVSGISNFQDAQLDDIQMWTKVLDASEIGRYMVTPPRGDEANLVAYYNFSRSRGNWVENVVTGQFDIKLSEPDLLEPLSGNEAVDTDNDGLTDDIEIILCSDPNNADTDSDGLDDGLEMGLYDEHMIGDPCLVDSDYDGIDDAYEYQQGWDALTPDDGALDDDDERSHWQHYVNDSEALAE
ncbi:LamG domain-containing protein, partial [Vibrio parahaemolyticus]|nr:LamG domain-containing protein [Vibrio parahaemolyticus]